MRMERSAIVLWWSELISVRRGELGFDDDKLLGERRWAKVYLLGGSFSFLPRACATGSKETLPSCDAEENDDDGSNSARSLVATAVDAQRRAGRTDVLACLHALLAILKPKSLVVMASNVGRER